MDNIETRKFLLSISCFEKPCLEYRVTIEGICKDALFYVFYDKQYDVYTGESNVLMYKPDSKKTFNNWLNKPILEYSSENSRDVVNKMIERIIDYFNVGYTHIVYTRGINE